MLILDELLLKSDVAYLFESLNAQGKVIDSLVSADSLKRARSHGVLDVERYAVPIAGFSWRCGAVSRRASCGDNRSLE